MHPILRTALTALAVAGGVGACGRGFAIETPAGFAELEGQKDYGYRATTAEGVVLAVRKKQNRPFGDLGFWAGAVDAHVRRLGYSAIEGRDVKSADGVEGKQVRYNASFEGRPHAFWATVFVTDSAVVTVETGGDAEFFQPATASVETAIASIEVR